MRPRWIAALHAWRWQLLVPAAVGAFLAAGAAARVLGHADAAAATWTVGLVITGLPLVWRTLRHLLHGNFATDVVAMLAIVVAVLIGQHVAGLVIVLMQTGGEALEKYAEGRASAAVRALEQDAPRIAHRILAGAQSEDVEVEAIAVGDMLLVRPGEMLPCDGHVAEGSSHVDTARITGEPLPVAAIVGTSLSSGSINLDGPLTLRATATAGESQYARIVELVRSAQGSKAPLQRLADRYAMWFTPITIVVCVIAYAVSGDWDRVLAVLVVATPCPLILATPVAIIGGVNKAARAHVIVRNGGAMEQLADVTTAVFDKTGTLTVGTPEVSRVVVTNGMPEGELLRLVASLEHRSGHLLARSIVRAATEAGVVVGEARDVTEDPGRGVKGTVEDHAICVGARTYAADCIAGTGRGEASPAVDGDGGLRAHVVIDGVARGTIEFADRVRPGLPAFFADLERLGIRRTLLLSGDSAAHTLAIAKAVGITDARGDLLPGDKVTVVNSLVDAGEHVLMVGDGTNDAPALSAAHVGIALAGHGGGITAEAADIVVLSDDLRNVADVIRISRRTLRIARQSIRVGLGLSAAAMLVAAAGHIVPIAGAVLQEAIDVAVILNALRTSR
ncbi:MAG: heavy metal translocating P-type ATPase [bacterium]